MHGLSLCQAVVELGVPVCLLLKWTKEPPRLKAHARLKKRAITLRGKDQLHPIEDELLMWIFSQREQGLSIWNTIVLLKVSRMLRDTFGAKSGIAWLQSGCVLHVQTQLRLLSEDEQGNVCAAGGVPRGTRVLGVYSSAPSWPPLQPALDF